MSIDRPEGAATDQTAPEPRRPSRPRKAAGAVLGLVVLAVGFGVYAMYFPAPRVPQEILTATEDGSAGYRQEGDTSEVPAIAATATKLESQRNVTSSSSTVSSGGSRLFGRTLAIYNLDDGLLMQRVGLALFEQLRDTGRFRQIRYLPAGKRLPDGERLPNVFVTLDKTSWEESGLPGRQEFKGKLVVTASDRFRRSSHSYSSNTSPPQLRYRWRADVDYKAQQTGIETSGARYQAVSRDLAKEITGQLTKLLDKLATQYGTAADLPETFYPEYIEPPEFSFVTELKAEKLVDGPQFMRPTIVVWRTPEDRIPTDVVATVGRSLAADGWKVSKGFEKHEYLRATHGGQVVVVFPESDGRRIAGEEADTPERVYIVYTREMSSDDAHAAVRKLFESEADESALLMFQNSWYRHRELVEKYFDEHPPTQADSWLQLARFRKKSQPDAAREALLRANALRKIVQQEAASSSMKKLAKELGIEELPEQISHEMIKTLGLEELREPGEITVSVRENEPAVIWLGDKTGGKEQEQPWLLLTPIHRPATEPEWTLRIQLLTLRNGGWSRSEQTGGDLTKTGRPVHIQHLGQGEKIQVFSEPADDGRSYRLTLRRTEPEKSG